MTEQNAMIAARLAARSTRRRRWWLVLVLFVVAAGLATSGWIWILGVEASLDKGKTLLRQRRELEAEKQLDRYLQLHPRNPEAILLWAEAVISGDSRTPNDAAKLAISRLSRIPDNSPLGAEARMREGRLTLLILHQADRAEQLLSRSAELNPELLDTQFLLWKLFDMTERFYYSEPYFWKTYELSADNMKAERLRDWFLSQFSPNSANAELDRRMGFLGLEEVAEDHTQLVRLKAFLAEEPQSPMVCAANAFLLLELRDRDEALRILSTIESLPHAAENAWYVAAMTTVLTDLGRLEEARRWFERWPAPHEGYLYWDTAGKVYEAIDRDDQSAADVYSKALQQWPGPVDWSLMHRKAQCLARLGKRDEAETVRQQAKRVEQLMETDVHRSLRLALLDLTNPDALQQMADFYRSLHCEREATCWQEAIDRLLSARAAVYSSK